jgi:hypothetical protein
LLNTNTEFSIKSEESSNSELIIQAHSLPPSDYFMNVMNFSTGELVFDSNFKNEYPDRRSGLNATEVISYQYLGMTKIAQENKINYYSDKHLQLDLVHLFHNGVNSC